MTQPGYVNSMMMPNYQSSAEPTPMNVNNGWTGQFVFPQYLTRIISYGISAGTDATWISESRADQPARESWSTSWWAAGNG